MQDCYKPSFCIKKNRNICEAQQSQVMPVQEFSSCLIAITLRLRYNAQPVNDV
jgi:hypothetical protein